MVIDVSALADVDAARLPYAQQIALLTEIERARACLDAAQQRVLATLVDSDPSEQQWVRDEVACALQIAPVTAAGRLHDATDLIERLPPTFDHLTDSSISFRHALVMLEHVRCLDDQTREAVERRVLVRAAGTTVSQFRQSVRRAVAALDPRGSEEQHTEAMTQRRVALTPQPSGMSELWALLPADGAAELMSTIVDCAARLDDPADERTADQKRADVLVGLARNAAHTAEQPVTAPDSTSRPVTTSATVPAPRFTRGPRVSVTVALSTLLECDDRPGELAGHGPIPASMARRIAADPTGSWRRLVTDAVGRPVRVSGAYRPPPGLAEEVMTRDGTCRFPGCRRAAHRCELDHVRPWNDGGPTCLDNLHALCPRHHHLKHDAPGWNVARSPDGITRWTAPSGQAYERAPEDADIA